MAADPMGSLCCPCGLLPNAPILQDRSDLLVSVLCLAFNNSCPPNCSGIVCNASHGVILNCYCRSTVILPISHTVYLYFMFAYNKFLVFR